MQLSTAHNRISQREKRKHYMRSVDLMTYKRVCKLVDGGFSEPEIVAINYHLARSYILDAIYCYQQYKKSNDR